MKLLQTIVACTAILGFWTATACAKSSFELRSSAFANGAAIPREYSNDGYGCTGKNISPPLQWSGEPKGTVAFALTVFDPDANGGKGWWHWVVYGIDRKTHTFAAAEPQPGHLGKNDFGKPGYGGPCPPPGDTPHHYVFTLYAVDDTPEGYLDGPGLVDAIRGHVLEKATLVGRFSR